jgi:hypothetical protein
VIQFLRAGVFAPLAERYDLYLVCYAGVHLGDADLGAFKEVITLKPERAGRSQLRIWMMYFAMWSGRHVTRHFSNSFERVFTMNLSYASRWQLWRQYYLPAAIPWLARLLTRFMEWRVGGNPEVVETIRRLQPDLIIGHARGYDAQDIDLLKAAKKLRVPVMTLQLNWDVFAHRGVVPAQPDYLGVWGFQSGLWTEYIQGVPKERTFLLGPPFSDLLRAPDPTPREVLCAELGLPPDKRVVLVAGCGRGTNETGLLIMLEAAIEAKLLPDCCVIYRPHPTRHRPRYEPSFFEQRFRHVVLDPMMAERYREAVERNRAMSKKGEIPIDYGYARRLFTVVSAMVAPITTFMLEAAYFGIPSVEIAFVDEANEAQNNRFDLPMSSYFQGLPGVFVCLSPEQLVAKVSQALAFAQNPREVEAMRSHVRAAVYSDGAEVKERLADAVERVLTGATPSRYQHLVPVAGRTRGR